MKITNKVEQEFYEQTAREIEQIKYDTAWSNRMVWGITEKGNMLTITRQNFKKEHPKIFKIYQNNNDLGIKLLGRKLEE